MSQTDAAVQKPGVVHRLAALPPVVLCSPKKLRLSRHRRRFGEHGVHVRFTDSCPTPGKRALGAFPQAGARPLPHTALRARERHHSTLKAIHLV